MMNCYQCQRPLASVRNIEQGKLVYACDKGHPNLIPITTTAHAREAAEVLSQKSFDEMGRTDTRTKFSMKWVTPTRLVYFADGVEFSYMEISEEKGH